MKIALTALALFVAATVPAAAPLCDSYYRVGACCKICRSGKACGNSCISRDKVCHQPPGCACDG